MVENEQSLLDCIGKEYLDQKTEANFTDSDQFSEVVRPRKALQPDYLPQVTA